MQNLKDVQRALRRDMPTAEERQRLAHSLENTIQLSGRMMNMLEIKTHWTMKDTDLIREWCEAIGIRRTVPYFRDEE